MKGIVASIIDQSIVRQFSGVRFVDIEFKEFKILNSFNKKINGENWYCAKIHTVYTGRALNPYTGQKNPRQTMTDTEQFRFQKQGNEWYGRKGW